MSARARTVKCAGPSCDARFTPERSTAKYHAPACRVAARRARQSKAAAKSPTAVKTTAPKREQVSGSAADKHALVVALRQELEQSKVLDTFEGQLALELARRLVTPGEGASSLVDKVRAARAAALGQVAPQPGGSKKPIEVEDDDEDDDEVTRARTRREESRKAAGLA